METSRMRRQSMTLAELFWRYLLLTGTVVLSIVIVGYFVLAIALSSGLVLPANTAMTQVEVLGRELAAGERTTAQIPYYFRWACLDETGQATTYSETMRKRQLEILREAAQTQTVRVSGFPYAQYHKSVLLPDGTRCILQYDFRPPYGAPKLQRYLPDFQITLLLIVLFLWGVCALWCTRRYAAILRRDIAVLTHASQQIAEQRLDIPFTANTQVRELGETLEAMEKLRQGLADSLEEQWAMEQQRAGEIAALTHDLKTPLTIISGNSELLSEEPLTPTQEKSVQAIFRNAQRMNAYVHALREAAGQAHRKPVRETVGLRCLFAEWCSMGEGICTPNGILFCAETPEEQLCLLCREQVSRAVLNLLDNAARYTPRGGTITLSAQIRNPVLIIRVTDTGSGFSQEALEKAGTIFYTEDASRPMDGHGGMGLCFVMRVAREHGGQLMLSNTEAGACAQMTLQIQSDSDAIFTEMNF